MPLRFQFVLLCCLILATLTPAHSIENIFGSADNDTLYGTTDNDEIWGGNGNDFLTGNDGDDVLRGGNGDDVLRGGNGDDVLDGGVGIDRLYGGLGADRFVFDMDAIEADEVIDFNPDQNDTIFLRRKYSEMDTNTKPYEITGESVRIDAEGDVEIQLKNSNWARIVRLNQHNLELNSREITGGLQLFFTRRF
jgi:hypothetical protein